MIMGVWHDSNGNGSWSQGIVMRYNNKMILRVYVSIMIIVYDMVMKSRHTK